MDKRYKQDWQEDTWYQAEYFGQKLPYDIMISGRIRSRYKRAQFRELGYHLNSWGYYTWRIRINKKSFHRLAHTIMAHTFLTLPEGYEYKDFTVNHIDGNKLNNHISNLEWCTFHANQIHKFDFQLQKSTKGIVDNNVYLFKNDDGREFIGSPRELFHKFKEEDRLFQQGIRNIIKGYNSSNGFLVTQHKGWRKIELVENTDPRFVERTVLYKPVPTPKTIY